MTERVRITYRLTPHPGQEIDILCRSIALEQTVEMAEDAIHSDRIRECIVGNCEVIEEVSGQPGCYQAVISYDAAVTGYTVPQFLNLLYGNISIKDNIRIVDVELPCDLLRRWRGPQFGISGVRAATGVHDRPLAATALKPMGLAPRELAAIAEEFARGGGDIVKDDHGLADQPFCRFRERVERCQEAVSRANQATGGTTLYFPNICAPFHEIEEHLDYVADLGVRGVLIAPFLLGLDTVRHVAQRYPLLIMAHPAFSGTHFHDRRHGIAPGVVLGTLFRLIGSDISIFPNAGGRFPFTQDDCLDIGRRLRAPLGELRPAMPAPAGGMDLERIPEMAAAYGNDAIFLIGGALLHDRRRIAADTAQFVVRIRRCSEDLGAGEPAPRRAGSR